MLETSAIRDGERKSMAWNKTVWLKSAASRIRQACVWIPRASPYNTWDKDNGTCLGLSQTKSKRGGSGSCCLFSGFAPHRAPGKFCEGERFTSKLGRIGKFLINRVIEKTFAGSKGQGTQFRVLWLSPGGQGLETVGGLQALGMGQSQTEKGWTGGQWPRNNGEPWKGSMEISWKCHDYKLSLGKLTQKPHGEWIREGGVLFSIHQLIHRTNIIPFRLESP